MNYTLDELKRIVEEYKNDAVRYKKYLLEKADKCLEEKDARGCISRQEQAECIDERIHAYDEVLKLMED